MYYVYFIISIIIFITFLTIAYLTRKKQVKSLAIILFGILLASFILILPLYNEEPLMNLIETLAYVVEMPTLSQDVIDLYDKLINIFVLYRYLLYFYYIMAPILTITVLFTFIKNLILLFKSERKTSNTVHIFTELNDKSFRLANTLKSSNNLVIICNPNDKKEYNYQAKIKNIILIKKRLQDLNFKNYFGKINIYAMEEDEDLNINHTLEFIKEEKDTLKNITYYLFSISDVARILIDSLDKGNIETILVNEIEKVIYNVLESKPLYLYAKDKHISVLIVGCGKVGLEFFKAILWCSQMIGYKLDIKVIDIKAKEIFDKLLFSCPEINKNNYNFEFIEKNIYSKLEDLPLNNINYIIVSLGDDSKNIECSLNLKRYYERNNQNPFIGLVIRNDAKRKQVFDLRSEKESKATYDLYPFGSMEELYGSHTILNEKIEELAKKIHLHYNKDDVNFKEYNKLEYNKKSSRANALHLKYKIYSVLGRDGNCQEVLEKLKDKKVLDSLAEAEHNRWMAYSRCEGYQVATLSDIKKYKDKTKSHINHLAKLHPCLIPFDELDKLSDDVNKLLNTNKDFRKSDYDVIEIIKDFAEQEKKENSNKE